MAKLNGNVQLSVWVSEEQAELIRQAALKNERSVSDYSRRILVRTAEEELAASAGSA